MDDPPPFRLSGAGREAASASIGCHWSGALTSASKRLRSRSVSPISGPPALIVRTIPSDHCAARQAHGLLQGGSPHQGMELCGQLLERVRDAQAVPGARV
jgi:hypothetical protein